MRILPRVAGIATALIALAVVAWWAARPDLHDRVRLASLAASSSTSSHGPAMSLDPAASPCTQADLDVWQLPTPPDAAARHVALYSNAFGTKRAGQGQTLVPGVIVDSVTPTQVTLVCAGGRVRRQIAVPQAAAPTLSATRLPAPLGN